MSSESSQQPSTRDQHALVRHILPVSIVALGILVAITLIVVNKDDISLLNPEYEVALPLVLDDPISFSGRIIGIENDRSSFTFEADVELPETPGKYETKTFSVAITETTAFQRVNMLRVSRDDASEALSPDDLTVGQNINIATQDNPQAVEKLTAQVITEYYRP